MRHHRAGTWAASTGQLLVKRFQLYTVGVYPDLGCTANWRTSHQMLELVSLVSLTLPEPGEAAYYAERWYLCEQSGRLLDDEGTLVAELAARVEGTRKPE